jgi:large subunit ribosomal protein L15
MRGFTNIFRKEYTIVNVGNLAKFPANSHVTARTMVDAGLIKNMNDSIKILGRGNLDNPLVVEAHRFSESAKQKITDSGGRIEEIQ